MDRENFYNKLVQALAQAEFRFDPEGFTESDVDSDRDGLARSIRMAIKLAPSVVKALTQVSLPSSLFTLHAVFDQEGVRRELDSVREHVSLVCFKYMLAQPVIVACVEADRLRLEEAVVLHSKFDEALLGMLPYTGKMGGLKIGGFHFGATRLGVLGILMYTFFDPASAAKFVATRQKSCKVLHFLKKTWLVPWVINVAAKDVISHSGLPIIVPQIVSPKRLKQTLFNV